MRTDRKSRARRSAGWSGPGRPGGPPRARGRDRWHAPGPGRAPACRPPRSPRAAARRRRRPRRPGAAAPRRGQLGLERRPPRRRRAPAPDASKRSGLGGRGRGHRRPSGPGVEDAGPDEARRRPGPPAARACRPPRRPAPIRTRSCRASAAAANWPQLFGQAPPPPTASPGPPVAPPGHGGPGPPPHDPDVLEVDRGGGHGVELGQRGGPRRRSPRWAAGQGDAAQAPAPTGMVELAEEGGHLAEQVDRRGTAGPGPGGPGPGRRRTRPGRGSCVSRPPPGSRPRHGLAASPEPAGVEEGQGLGHQEDADGARAAPRRRGRGGPRAAARRALDGLGRPAGQGQRRPHVEGGLGEGGVAGFGQERLVEADGPGDVAGEQEVVTPDGVELAPAGRVGDHPPGLGQGLVGPIGLGQGPEERRGPPHGQLVRWRSVVARA